MGEMEIVRCGNGNREMCKLNETEFHMFNCCNIHLKFPLKNQNKDKEILLKIEFITSRILLVQFPYFQFLLFSNPSCSIGNSIIL